MENVVQQIVAAIHASPFKIVYVTAGAGTHALSELLAVSGASQTLLEAVVPYSSAAFAQFLGQAPQQHVAPKTAKLLAGRALTRASFLNEKNCPLIGLACTATIATNRPKRGAHRAHIALWKPDSLTWYGLQLQKGLRSRLAEEDLVSGLVLNALASACEVETQLPLPFTGEDLLQSERSDFAAAIAQLQRGENSFLGIHAHGLIRTKGVRPQVLLPGAFNPLHEGHLDMARAAAQILESPVAFELSVANADKETLSSITVQTRLAQFAGRYPVYASRAATFVEKAALYPGATFVIGYDTAVRIFQPRYYDHSVAQMHQALSTIRAQGCRFIVAGRKTGNAFHDVAALPIPDGYAELFMGIPETIFRLDISSTELRQQGKKGSR